LQSL
jgi:hypothetical protein